MKRAIGRLNELDLEPGDVVQPEGTELVYTAMARHPAGYFDGLIVMRDSGDWCIVDRDYHRGNWHVLSRAANTPKRIRDMTDAEVGALVRAFHAGKTIECWSYAAHCWHNPGGAWKPDFGPDGGAYRVRPEPKRVRVTFDTPNDGVTLLISRDNDHDDYAVFLETREGEIVTGEYTAKDGSTILVGKRTHL